MDNSKNELPHIPTTPNKKRFLKKEKIEMLHLPAKQKFSLKKNRNCLKEIYEMYWNFEAYLHGNEMKRRYKFTIKEICEKFDLDSIHELIFLLLNHQKEYSGTCLFCKEDYFQYEIRSGKRSTYCGCKGICKECNKPYSCASHQYKQTCSNCAYNKNYETQKNEEKEKSDFLFIAFHADAQELMIYYNDSDIRDIVSSMKKRLKFLQSYLKLSGIK